MASDRSTTDLETIVDTQPLSRFQLAIIVMCALIAVLDGFDTQCIAFVAPAIAAAWQVEPSRFGPIFGIGILGGLFGALVLGILGDRLGRKPSLLVSVLLFAAGSLATPFVSSMTGLGALRLVTGFGLGGALPSFIALTSEYAPLRRRALVVGMMFCGFPMGAVVGGIAASRLIPAFGWPSVFVAGGVLPLVILPIFMAVVPESLRFLALRQDRDAIARILARMGATQRWDGRLAVREPQAKAPLRDLFHAGRGLGTVLLWLTLFLSMMLTYFLVNWIPLVVTRGGLPVRSAVLSVSMLNLGAIVGCVTLGRLAGRFGLVRTIGAGYAVGALAIAAIGQAGGSVTSLYATTFAAGFFSIGAQMCTVALCAGFYPTFLRATGVGAAMSVGRFGAIVGPVLGGLLLMGSPDTMRLFVMAGATSAGAAVTLFLLARRPQAQAGVPA